MDQVPKQSVTEIVEKIIAKVKETLPANGINDIISEVIVTDKGLTPEGFVSDAQYVTVKFENPEVKPLNLFVKLAIETDFHKEMLGAMKAFEKEARFLMEYLPAAQQLCKLKGLEGFIDFYPKCYFADEKMTLLENLVLDRGYVMVDKELRQDLEAAKFAITTLAKHHALSHAMIQETGGAEKFFKKFPNLDHEPYYETFIINMGLPLYENANNCNVKILEKSGIPGGKNAAAKLKSFLGKATQIEEDTLRRRDDDSIFLLNHGDYWNNNMMFLKDKETNQIKHHMAIDFQITRYNSIGADLGYYMYMSLQPQVRKNHLQELLQLYTDTINSVSKTFGHPLNLSVEKVFTEYRRKMAFGFWVGHTFAVGPVMTIFRNTDRNNVDMNEWVELCDKLVETWVNENPEKTKEVAEELLQMVEEYEEMVL